MKTKLKLVPKVAPQVKFKTVLIYAAVGFTITTIVGLIAFFVFNIGLPEKAKAAANFNSRKNGDWTFDDTWSERKPNSPVPQGQSVAINAGNEVFVPSGQNLRFNQNSILYINGILVVRDKLLMDQKSELYVGPEGVLIVMGDFDVSQKFTLVNHGKVVLLGNFETGQKPTITNNGDFYSDAKSYITSGEPEQPTSATEKDEPLMAIMSRYGNYTSNLPVSLLNFSAEEASGNVALKWTTLSEINNDFFTIERSTDGKVFETIGTTPGAGSSLIKIGYTYTDYAPLPGLSYYRLKQTDYNGDFEYFKIISLSKQPSQEEFKIISVAPNPFSEQFNVSYNAGATEAVKLQLINSRGEQVYAQVLIPQQGNNKFEFRQGYSQAKGIYFLKLSQSGNETKLIRLIKE